MGESTNSNDIFFRKLAEEFEPSFFSTSPDDLKAYGTDWTTRFLPNPLLICFPSSTSEVSKLLKLCHHHQIKVVPSGGRTGLAGGAVATRLEVVLSLKNLNRILDYRPNDARIRVQAGVVHSQVQDHVSGDQLMWPIDLASKGSSLIGGNIATNAGGIRVVRYGHCRNWVQSLEVVLADGSIFELSGDLEKNNTGYDLKQLFIGSEGTLGIITEATLKLVPKPHDSQVLLFGAQQLSDALDLFSLARRHRLDLLAAEFFESSCLQAVMEVQSLPAPLATLSPVYGILEMEMRSDDDRRAFDSFLEEALAKEMITDGTAASDEATKRSLWKYRETITESLSRLGTVYKNDLALPLRQLPVFLDFMHAEDAFRNQQIQVYLFGHFGDGNVHVNLVKAGALTEAQRQAFFEFCEQSNHTVFTELKRLGGSIAAEHGIGLLKKDYLTYTRPPAEIELMQKIKRALDPQMILNPGKIFDPN